MQDLKGERGLWWLTRVTDSLGGVWFGSDGAWRRGPSQNDEGASDPKS